MRGSRHAIETYYKGYWFRSRTEARWAVFLDHYWMRWDFEPEGYRLPREPDLPDFWMFDWKCWIEAKGEENEESTPRETARELREITKAPVILAIHSPSYEYAFLYCWRATDSGIEPFECPAIFVVTHDDTLAVVPDCLPQMKLVDAKGHPMKFLTTFAGARSAPMGGYLASRGKRFEHEDRECPKQQLRL